MTKTSPGGRRKARATALQTLFEVDSTDHDFAQSLDWLLEDTSLPEETVSFTWQLVSKVLENMGTIDELIQRFAPAWPLQQMATVDRNILRLGVAEILFEAVPAKVAINEAVELAKTFGSENSARFVNGVLGSIYTEFTNKKEKGVT